MKYYKLECENKKGGISIIPIYPLSVIPYKILDEKSVLLKIQLKEKSKNQQLIEMIFFLVSGTLNILVPEDLAIKMKAENFTNLLLEDIEETFEFII